MARSQRNPEADSTDCSARRTAGGMRFERGSRGARRGAGDRDVFTYIGTGEPGGKAAGLAAIKASLERAFPGGAFQDIRISIPRMTVLLTGVFEQFMQLNNLYEVARSSAPDFSTGCALTSVGTNSWIDPETPAPGALFAYLNHAAAPLVGSWGADSTGFERNLICP